MGFAQKIAASQNNQMPGTNGGAPPSGYTGGPPSALQPGNSQYQAYPGSPPPQGSDMLHTAHTNNISLKIHPHQLLDPTRDLLRSPLHPTPHNLKAMGAHLHLHRKASPMPPPVRLTRDSPMDTLDRLDRHTLDNNLRNPSTLDNPSIPDSNHTSDNSPLMYSRTPGQAPPYPTQGPPQGAPYPGGQGRPGPSPGPPSGPPPGHYGPPGGVPGGPSASAPPATQQQAAAYRQLLISCIQEKNLQPFYPPERLDRLVQSLAAQAPSKLARLIHEWAVPMEVATDVMKLALFDVILYVDDSGSIEFEEKGLRKDQLRQILGIVATAASTFDEDGISVRFMNSVEQGDGIRDAEDVNRLVSRVRFSGLTPLGTSLKSKVIDPMVVGPARQNRLEKPVLVITITDGQPAGEPHGAVGDVIRHAVEETSRTRYGPGAVSFQFSQVGTDTRARDFLSSLDEDPHIGHLIDCTSNFEVEQDEMSRANPPVHLTRELWCAKLMLGAIDSSYDTKDEQDNDRRGPPPAPAGQYGGYNQPPPQSQGPPTSFNPPPGAPPGYNPQAGPGYPQAPQQAPQQPQYQASRSAYGQQQPYGYPPQQGSGHPPYGQPPRY
ncbi:hypothetical protein N7508_001646 [Penicillium antarcticum]|uniref:uncharacterized protein n=1 Tax=Penicillium antarcticum TaxID=416450 RepID=UPI002394E40B|nr:uncharacterized protein N7508_001646 [Penicillium antarcticum]KAJ5317138.1 hypothetical protein N7508_001646 [Penicillium antarcticum]